MILLTGGTGMLGARVLDMLLALRYPVRLVTRGGEDWQNIFPAGVEPFVADLRDLNKMDKALSGCNIVINLAGIMRNTSEASMQEINVEAVEGLVALAEKYAVQRFIHVGCLGTSGQEAGGYFASKLQSEELVRKSHAFHWTIFRPSFMFGPSFVLLDILLPMVKLLPVVPIIGTGLNQIQPVAVDDVAACVVQSIYQKDTAGQVYDLPGPATYSMQSLVQLLLNKLGQKKSIMNIPSDASMKFVRLIEKIYAKGTVNEDFIQLLLSESTGSPDRVQAAFPVHLTALEDRLDQLLGLNYPASQSNVT